MIFPADFAFGRRELVHPLLSSSLFYGETTMEAWAMEEFAGAALGDGRLNQRLVKLATRFADKPTASIPGACADWSETQAAYRFFEQSSDQKRQLGWQDILAPHIERTEARMRQHPVVLCLQDTTELDFNGQETVGLGPLSYEAQRGMYLHPTYVVTPEREPLGVTDAWMWAREAKGADGQRPGLRESRRWVEGYERIAETARNLPDTRLVYVADREADILELMQCAHQLGTPADWLIRSQHNRSLLEGGKLWTEVLAGMPLGEIEFTLAARQGQAAREVRQQVWACPIRLPDGQGDTLSVTCLIAREMHAPAGSKPVEWRLARLVKLGRTHPDIEASLLFTDAEWKGVYILAKKAIPKTAPSLREVVRQIATLGGFLGRKSDGEPGVKTLWLGMQRLRDFVEGMEHMRAIYDAK